MYINKVDTSVTLALVYVEQILNRNSDTILPIIKKILRNDIQCDESNAYSSLYPSKKYIHLSISYKHNFESSLTGVHKENVKALMMNCNI